MIFILIFVISFLILSIREYKDCEDILGSIILGGLKSIIVTILLGAICFSIISVEADIQTVPSSNTQLYALQDSNSVQGTFFMGCGSIDGSMKYTYLIKDGDAFQLKTINTNGVNIKETDSEPHIVFYKNVYKNPKVAWWVGDVPIIDNPNPEIYIPKGTIEYGFNIDLK